MEGEVLTEPVDKKGQRVVLRLSSIRMSICDGLKVSLGSKVKTGIIFANA
jgi:hypothetical protein